LKAATRPKEHHALDREYGVTLELALAPGMTAVEVR